MATPVTLSDSPARFPALVSSALIAVATALAYANTFSVPFVFDDIAAITQNPSLARFSTALFPPDGLSVTGRPLVNLSLALNYALSRESPWSYHVLNLALHVTNALLLFALLRHTLALLQLKLSSFNGEAAAFAAAALWSLHPLHTAAVTYVMQRSELLVSACVLGTFVAFTRSLTAPSHAARWLTGSAFVCLLGMTAKEVMAPVPLLVLLYDRTFVAGSFRAALRQRSTYYAALAATWLPLAWLVLGTENRGASAGFSSAVAWTDYALTQLHAVPHYLRLALWPSPLVFDYGTPLVLTTALLLPSALILLSLLTVTAVALVRWPAAGFCGSWFFALLAPTSSLVPIATQTVAEHRPYLALAAPFALLVVAAHRVLSSRRLLLLVTPLALACAAVTFVRNTDYRTALALWSDTVAKKPTNPRAHYNLAITLLTASPARDPVRADAALTETLRLDPAHPFAAAKLGATRLELGRFADAIAPLTAALHTEPETFTLHYQLAAALLSTDQTAPALPHLAAAVRLDPAHAAARANYARALAALGRYAEALLHFDEAARLDPTDASAPANASRIREYLQSAPR